MFLMIDLALDLIFVKRVYLMKPRKDMWEIHSTVYTLTINYNLLLLFFTFSKLVKLISSKMSF